MKFKCDRRLIANWLDKKFRRKIDQGEHLWFAWYPVKVGLRDCRWLERVRRQFYSTSDNWWLASVRVYHKAKESPHE